MFGFERYGVRPDVVTLAKGITSGYLPLGASVVSRRDLPDDQREAAGPDADQPRLHLHGPSHLLRRRAREHRHHRARAPARERGRRRRLSARAAARGARRLRLGRRDPRRRADDRHRAGRRQSDQARVLEAALGVCARGSGGLGARTLRARDGHRGGRARASAHDRPRLRRPDRRDPRRVDRGDGGRRARARAGPGGAARRAPRRTRSRSCSPAMASRFDPAKADGVELVVQYALTGDGGGTWIVAIRDGELSIDRATEEQAGAAATVRADAANYLQIVNGELSGAEAFSTRQLVIEGDLAQVAKLAELGLVVTGATRFPLTVPRPVYLLVTWTILPPLSRSPSCRSRSNRSPSSNRSRCRSCSAPGRWPRSRIPTRSTRGPGARPPSSRYGPAFRSSCPATTTCSRSCAITSGSRAGRTRSAASAS